MEYHFPAVGLISRSREGGPRNDERQATTTSVEMHAINPQVAVIGINPPEHITSVETLVSLETKNGIGLWRRDLYGVGVDLAGKRRRRGWRLGMEEVVFVNAGLEDVVEELVCWDGGRGNDLFPRLEQLPWFRS